MNFSAIEHYSDSKYSFALNKKEVKVRLRLGKNDDISSVYCLWNNALRFYKKQFKNLMVKEFSDDLFDYFTTVLTIDDDDPRLSYIFYIESKSGNYFYSEDGFSTDYDFNLSYYNRFSICYVNSSDIYGNHTFEGNVFYQVFPERFKNGKGEKKYINRSWNSLDLKGTNNNRIQDVFLGGDFLGIYEKIDYLKKIGIDVLYLTPICKSPSNHKYDVIDYFDFDPMFGSRDDFKKIVNKLHENNMKIVLDLVFNHSSNHNPMFIDAITKGKNSKFYNFYFIHDKKYTDSGVNYETFGFTDQMPKLNSNDFSEQEYFAKVGQYFITEFNVDGYRLDVANEVSHSFWRYFKHEVRKVKSDIILIGENWTDATSFISPSELDTVMNYPFLLASKYFFVDKKYDASQYANRLNTLLARYTDNTNRIMLNMLDSHDTIRFYDFVKPNKNLYLLAFLSLISYLGMPMIYYGDEIFMEGESDPDNRRGMKWDSSEFKSQEHDVFLKILKLRKINAFRNGDIKVYSKDNLFYIERKDEKETYLIIFNNTNSSYNIETGNVVLSNNYTNGILSEYGFIVKKTK